jgi:L-ascorbate metabolism protein UlaG (beta-lactamase superfamily)
MITFGIIIALTIGGITYMHTAEQFGEEPTAKDYERYAASTQLENGRFQNLGGVEMEFKFSSMKDALYEMLTVSDQSPGAPLPVAFDRDDERNPLTSEEFAVTWFGHSTVMLEIDGKRLLLDPSLSPSASPLPIFGKRFKLEKAIDIDRIPPLDAVLISHDHYDHLDCATVKAIAGRTRHFYVPLGVGAHLLHWGIPREKITELDWWNETQADGIGIVSTPAQHFSGRGLTDRNRTLWTSWVIKGKHATIFFSGDSGYGQHFSDIGERYGPFDFTMMECGQYNEKWRSIHSMPEESVQAHLDLGGSVMMPIHWGGFNLAPHPWTEPVDRVRAAAAAHGVRLALPMIGQRFIPSRKLPNWEAATVADATRAKK